jgi:hypothetical protein
MLCTGAAPTFFGGGDVLLGFSAALELLQLELPKTFQVKCTEGCHSTTSAMPSLVLF